MKMKKQSKLTILFNLKKNSQKLISQRKEAQNKALVTSLNQQVETLTKEKVPVLIKLLLKYKCCFFKKFLERQLEIEKDKFENDTKKLQALINEYTKEKELLLQQHQQQQLNLQHQSSNEPASPSSANANNSIRFSQLLESQMRNSGLFNSLNNSNGANNVLEMLQSKLKQKEGEIQQLQVKDKFFLFFKYFLLKLNF